MHLPGSILFPEKSSRACFQGHDFEVAPNVDYSVHYYRRRPGGLPQVFRPPHLPQGLAAGVAYMPGLTDALRRW
jgi:hypothetical protein